ncbi:MAG: crossover junction endodeoxyribonuclease RuvC [Brevinematales bacterium]|jgi:crossover junction endodeoxyribonuclease RuvC
MTALGIDPGYGRLGYSFIEEAGDVMKIISYGLISTDSKLEKPVRFHQIYLDLEKLISEKKPSFISMEKIIFAKNVKTALEVSEIRGVIILLSAIHGLPLYEFTPLQIKMAVTGYGRSGKEQIRKAVEMIFSMQEISGPDDISDALAIGVCGLGAYRYKEKIREARA